MCEGNVSLERPNGNSNSRQEQKRRAETVSVHSFIMNYFYVFVCLCTARITGHIGMTMDAREREGPL
jgi:hypothetical protein